LGGHSVAVVGTRFVQVGDVQDQDQVQSGKHQGDANCSFVDDVRLTCVMGFPSPNEVEAGWKVSTYYETRSTSEARSLELQRASPRSGTPLGLRRYISIHVFLQVDERYIPLAGYAIC